LAILVRCSDGDKDFSELFVAILYVSLSLEKVPPGLI